MPTGGTGMNLRKYGQEFYDLDVTVTGLLCLELLDASNPFASEQVADITEHLEAEEYAELFGLQPDELDDGDVSDITHEYVIMERRGWIVAANIMEPRNIRFDKTGKLEGYSSSTTFRPILTYHAELGFALDIVIGKAMRARKEFFDKARREQGLPSPE